MHSSQLIRQSLALSLVIGAAFSPAVQAASIGTLGATSTGSANISVTKSVQAQISDLTDMTLSNWTIGSGAIALSSNVCVYSSTGNYKVTATGNGLANVFTIASGLNLVPYSVVWNAGGVGALGNTGTSLTTNVQSAEFNNASTASATCSGGGVANDTARVIVNIASTDITAAASSSTAYTGTLTMLITPY